MSVPYTKSLDHLGLVAGFCKDIHLAELIDNALGRSDERKISFGQLFVAMLLNGLGFTGRTLHMYSEYFESKPLERLIGPGILPEHINDDALGRCLDGRLYVCLGHGEIGVADESANKQQDERSETACCPFVDRAAV